MEKYRQRMRERVQNYGLDSLAEHEALEYVLYLTNAQKDTNGIAHDLIDRFGDFAAVLEASEEELCTVEGVGPATARMLHLLPEISRYYGRSRTSTTRCIRTTEQMGSYLMAKFAWSDYERAMLVSLDSRKRVRAAVWLREGTQSPAPILSISHSPWRVPCPSAAFAALRAVPHSHRAFFHT